MTPQQRQNKLHAAHDRKGKRLYGKRRWAMANSGWYSDSYSIHTKVYPLNNRQEVELLISTIGKDGTIRHEQGTY